MEGLSSLSQFLGGKGRADRIGDGGVTLLPRDTVQPPIVDDGRIKGVGLEFIPGRGRSIVCFMFLQQKLCYVLVIFQEATVLIAFWYVDNAWKKGSNKIVENDRY